MFRSGGMRNRCSLWLLLSLGLHFQSLTTQAHRLDECLQAARIEISPQQLRIELDLTPGVAVAEQVIQLLDVDRDERISPSEADAYSELVLVGLTSRVDSRSASLQLHTQRFPSVGELREGTGTIQLEFIAPLSKLSRGSHRLVFNNTHASAISVYLANALQPSDPRIQITRQTRDPLQRLLEIHFSVLTPPSLRFRSVRRS